MILIDGKRQNIRARLRMRWHDWFAWYPVYVEGDVVWLETVRQRAEYVTGYDGTYVFWKYKRK